MDFGAGELRWRGAAMQSKQNNHCVRHESHQAEKICFVFVEEYGKVGGI